MLVKKQGTDDMVLEAGDLDLVATARDLTSDGRIRWLAEFRLPEKIYAPIDTPIKETENGNKDPTG